MTNDDILNDPDIEVARLGIEAEAFIRSNFGKYVTRRIEEHVTAHTAKLVDADPDDVKVNRDLRNEIRLCQMLEEWIVEAVNSGRLATRALHERDALEQ